MARGSTYTYRTGPCKRECGAPEERKRCPRRRSGHTLAGFVVGIRKIAPGKWEQLRRQGFATRGEAEGALADEIPDVRLGKARSLADRQITVASWAPLWLESKVKLKPSSREAYRLLLDTYIVPALGRVRLLELSAAHIDSFLAEVRSGRLRPERNYRGPDGKLSARSIQHIYACLHAMVRSAVARRLIPFDPCFGVELETPAGHEVTVWGPEQAERFLRFAEEREPRLAIGYRLALRFALRRGEILALPWAEIGDDIHVRHNAVAVGARVEVGTPKSAAGDRWIPLDADPGMAGALRRHRKRQLSDRLAAGENWEESGLLVADQHGRMVVPWRLTAMFKALIAEAGLPPLTLHEGRHTANSLWREAKIDSRVRQVWMGHGTMEMTDLLYNHVRPEASDAAAKLAAAYWAANGGSI
jgi:integrase